MPNKRINAEPVKKFVCFLQTKNARFLQICDIYKIIVWMKKMLNLIVKNGFIKECSNIYGFARKPSILDSSSHNLQSPGSFYPAYSIQAAGIKYNHCLL